MTVSIEPVRPRFVLRLSVPPEEAIAQLRAAWEREGSRWVGRVLGEHVDITLRREHRRLFSPCVHVELTNLEEAGSVGHALVGPHPSVWTFFAFSWITLATAAAIGALLGVVQAGLGQSPWGFWTLAPALLLAAGLFGAAHVGRRLAAEETAALRAFVETALAEPPAA